MQTRRTEDASTITPFPPGSDPGRFLGLRNWRVRSKLIAVLVIPAVAFLVLASFGIGTSLRDVRALDRGSKLAELSRHVTALVHELQSERDLSAGYLEEKGRKANTRPLSEQQPRVDQQASAYREAEASLYDALGPRLRSRFDAARAGLADLAGLREAIRSESLTGTAVFEEYSQLINALLDVDLEIAEPGGDEELAQRVRAFNDLSRAKEVTAEVRGTLHAIAYRDAFAFGEFQGFADLLAQQRAAFEQFQVDADEQQRGQFADVVKGQAVLAVDRMANAALNRQSSSNLGVSPQQWLAASDTQIELMRTVESQLLDGVITQSRELISAARSDALRNALLIALILAVALLALFVVARSMAHPLQRLRAGAMDIAEHRLPDAVERLRTTESGDLDVRVEPVGIRSRDEIGQVAQAVDAIQEVAVRLASEQSALRRSIGDMFTNLARRSQALIDRQLELIDDLERNEADPETLEHLFRLDHLATRMRRNAEDLIVLSGADPGRHWVQPMTLVDVVRAAAAEVEEYQRVEFLPLADLEVAGHASVDVIHLLAELIENATAFSPPNTKVQIAGQAVPHGYVIEIEDRGLGMSDEELIQANERLANPPEIDFALSRVLGLYVVGRLAQRHGIKVQLRHSWYGGITALTLLPHAMLVWPKVPQAVTEPAGVVQGRAELPPPARAAEPAAEATATGDHLPIFEAARSDWFVIEPVEPAPLPHRQRQHQAARAEEDGVPSRPAPDASPPPYRPAPAARAGSEEPPLPQRPVPAARADEPEPYRTPRESRADEQPTYRPAPAARAEGPSPYGDEPAQTADTGASPYFERSVFPSQAGGPAPAQAPVPPPPGRPSEEPAAQAPPAPASRLTQAGLPRRVPRANLAPGMVVAAQQDEGGQPQPGAARSPDEVRSMLSSYRTGIERGRMVAGGSDVPERPDDAP